jgi:hypothetical protein
MSIMLDLVGTEHWLEIDEFSLKETSNLLVTEGRFGLGTTSPSSKLTINGGVGTLSTGLSFGDGDTGLYELTDDNLIFQTLGSDRLTIDENGYIGIGTTNPSSTLEITPTGTDLLSLNNSSGSERFSFTIDGGDSSLLKLRNTNDEIAIQLSANSATNSYLNSGNFGLGTNNPSEQLTVAGDTRITTKPTAAAWDIESASYSGVSMGTPDGQTQDLSWSNDGTKMYLPGGNSSKIYEYHLSVPFDISTASYHISIDTQSSPLEITWNNNGTKLYELASSKLYEYDVSTPFDISTAIYSGVNIDTQEAAGYKGMTWNNDGTKLYETGRSTDKIYEYDVSTPFDLSTATYSGVNIDTQDINPTGLSWNNDGTQLYEIGWDSDKIYEYDVSTPFDLSTATYSGRNINTQNGYSTGIAWNNDGTKLYEASFTGIYEYTLSSGTTGGTLAVDTSIGIGETSPNFGLEIAATSTSGYLGITNSTVGDILSVDGDGNVGIGTTAPSSKLDVSGNGRFYDQTAITGSTTLTIRAGAGQATNPLTQWLDNSGNNLAVMSSDGRLGIGTTTPDSELEVSASTPEFTLSGHSTSNDITMKIDSYGFSLNNPSYALVLDNNGRLGIGGAAGTLTTMTENLEVEDGLKIIDSNSPYDTLVHLYDSSDDGIIDVYQDTTATIRLHGNGNSYFNGGNIGIGTTEPSQKLDVVGSIKSSTLNSDGAVYSSGGVLTNTDPSDERLKKEIEALEDYTLEKVLSLNPVSFKYKDSDSGEREKLGFIAQELEELYPSLIGELPNGYKGIYTQDLIPILTKAIQEIDVQNQEWILNQVQNDKELEEQKTLLTSLYEREEEFAELTLTVEGLNETDTMIIGKLSDHENEIALLKADLLNVKTQIDPNYSNEIQMSNDLISSYSSLEDLGNLLASNEDEEGDTIFTLTADLELVNLKAERGEFEEIESEKANFEDVTVAGINVGENSSGKAVIMPGEKEVVIESALVKENSIIHLTLTSKKNGQDIYIKEIIEEENFVVEIEEGEALKKLEFNWLIIN